MWNKVLTGLIGVGATSLFSKKYLFASDLSESKGSKSNKVNFSSPGSNLKNLREVSFLVLGETGTGKTTLVNILANYFTKSKLDNPHIVIPTKFYPIPTLESYLNSETDVKNQSKAQTQKAQTYSFVHQEKRFNIIDTPGLNDPRGFKEDDKNLEIILEAAEKANTLSAIVLVLNGTQARITPNIQNILTRLQGSLPDSITNNIIVVYTMCREETCNQNNIEALGFKPYQIVHFNNTAFCSAPENHSSLSFIEWEESMNSSEKLTTFLEELAPVATNEFTQIKLIRSKIKSVFQEGRNKLQFLQQLSKEYQEKLIEKSQAEKDMKKNSDFKEVKTITKTILVPINYYSTICSECNTVCHDNCGLTETKTKGENIFSTCSCMGPEGACKVCPKNCSFTTHYHDYKTVKNVQVKVDQEIDSIKNKYLSSQALSLKCKEKIDDIQITKDALKQEIKQQQEQIKQFCYELKKICKNYNIVNEIYLFLDMMKKDLNLITDIDARRNAQEFIRDMTKMTKNL